MKLTKVIGLQFFSFSLLSGFAKEFLQFRDSTRVSSRPHSVYKRLKSKKNVLCKNKVLYISIKIKHSNKISD